MPDALPARVHGDSRAWEVRVTRVLRLGRFELERRVPTSLDARSIVVVVRSSWFPRRIEQLPVQDGFADEIVAIASRGNLIFTERSTASR